MDLVTLFFFILGFAFLIAGAEVLVRGASWLAEAVGISPLVVGLTVVSFGTSAPELAVSVAAELAGQNNISLGNIIGSNIANILLILGLSALAAPLIVHQKLVRFEIPLLIGVSVLALLMALDGLTKLLKKSMLESLKLKSNARLSISLKTSSTFWWGWLPLLSAQIGW